MERKDIMKNQPGLMAPPGGLEPPTNNCLALGRLTEM